MLNLNKVFFIFNCKKAQQFLLLQYKQTRVSKSGQNNKRVSLLYVWTYQCIPYPSDTIIQWVGKNLAVVELCTLHL